MTTVTYQREHDKRPLPLVEDLDGHDHLKPDPLTAHTPKELEELLRAFWRWSGSPGCRKIAVNSGGRFSHGTISKLIYNKADKPELSMLYLQGCILGCGGSEEEVRRWVTAWREIHLSTPRVLGEPSTNGSGSHG